MKTSLGCKNFKSEFLFSFQSFLPPMLVWKSTKLNSIPQLLWQLSTPHVPILKWLSFVRPIWIRILWQHPTFLVFSSHQAIISHWVWFRQDHLFSHSLPTQSPVLLQKQKTIPFREMEFWLQPAPSKSTPIPKLASFKMPTPYPFTTLTLMSKPFLPLEFLYRSNRVLQHLPLPTFKVSTTTDLPNLVPLMWGLILVSSRESLPLSLWPSITSSSNGLKIRKPPVSSRVREFPLPFVGPPVLCLQPQPLWTSPILPVLLPPTGC